MISLALNIFNFPMLINYTRDHTNRVVSLLFIFVYLTTMDTYFSYDSEFDCPAVYAIKVRGKIGSASLSGIEELTLTYLVEEDNSINTVLSGLLEDQAALNGVLNVISSLQLTIVSVVRIGDCLHK
jgi:hypothetical protein